MSRSPRGQGGWSVKGNADGRHGYKCLQPSRQTIPPGAAGPTRPRRLRAEESKGSSARERILTLEGPRFALPVTHGRVSGGSASCAGGIAGAASPLQQGLPGAVTDQRVGGEGAGLLN